MYVEKNIQVYSAQTNDGNKWLFFFDANDYTSKIYSLHVFYKIYRINKTTDYNIRHHIIKFIGEKKTLITIFSMWQITLQ